MREAKASWAAYPTSPFAALASLAGPGGFRIDPPEENGIFPPLPSMVLL
jgi:hypothetical protein